MRDIVEEDIVCCDSCSFRIVAGDECDNGIETLCADCYAADYAADQKADALMLWQMRKTQGAAS